jgi:ABC-type branched-subunit amino acid transport system ATPase component
MLSVEGLSVTFGGVRAVDNVSLEVEERTVVGLIGPNGAGKSTMINAITGVIRPTRGRVRLGDHDLVGRPPQVILAAGLARTFQQAQLWAGMTVFENIALPLEATRAPDRRSRVLAVAEQLGITDLLGARPGEISFGRRRLVEIGRAAVTRPSVVLLDEPGGGLTQAEKANLVGVLQDLAMAGTSVLLVDHDMELVMNSCQRVLVLNAGRLIAGGLPQEIRVHPEVVAAYLGTEQA